jgi:hypothetical protein
MIGSNLKQILKTPQDLLFNFVFATVHKKKTHWTFTMWLEIETSWEDSQECNFHSDSSIEMELLTDQCPLLHSLPLGVPGTASLPLADRANLTGTGGGCWGALGRAFGKRHSLFLWMLIETITPNRAQLGSPRFTSFRSQPQGWWSSSSGRAQAT